MNTSLCLYFQVHQPFRIREDYSFFNIGTDHNYEDQKTNENIIKKVARKCYLPTNQIMLKLLQEMKGDFKISFSLSGVALEQFELYAPEVLDSFKRLVDTGHVELLAETYYHSLAFVKSKNEFTEQVIKHRNKIKELFGVTPTTFRNTELIYNNELAQATEELGFKAILAEGVDRVLNGRSPNLVYKPSGSQNIKLLLKNYKLSDDIAFRFSNKKWKHYPLTASKYKKWIDQESKDANTINLFMDYETFGEHQWKESGIFTFLKKLPKEILKNKNIIFQTPAEVAANHPAIETIDCEEFTSWADENRDLDAWLGNGLQQSAVDLAYSLEGPIKELKDEALIHTWRKLLSSDHSYYASTKEEEDGSVHQYFSPFSSPHQAYLSYVNVLNDLKHTISQRS